MFIDVISYFKTNRTQSCNFTKYRMIFNNDVNSRSRNKSCSILVCDITANLCANVNYILFRDNYGYVGWKLVLH